jgi:UDP-N-acetylglucosamine acyltransferase
MIHCTAVIDPKAQVDPTVTVGPYAVIDAHVTLGAHCTIGPYVHLTGHTTIGAHNSFHAGCVIGDAPQDMKYKGEPTRLRIGDHNTFREHVTIHRSNKLEEDTVLGSNNYLMAHAHVGHNCVLGDHITIVNTVLLAGHVTVGDRAVMGGGSAAHQFVRVGRLSMAAGRTILRKDLPPFTLGYGANLLSGLNAVGLRRAGLTNEQRLEIKRLYHLLLRGKGLLRDRIEQARREFTNATAVEFIDFMGSSKRGTCRDAGTREHQEEY